MNLFSRLHHVLSQKWFTWLILPICILLKSTLITFYSFVGRDKIYHLATVDNFLNGKGWTNSFYYAENINNEVLVPFCHWPPGYGLLISPFHSILQSNILWSTTIFELFFFLLYIFIARSILRKLGLASSWVNGYTIILCFFPYNFLEDSLGTDTPSVCFILGFIYFIIRMWQDPPNKRNVSLFGIAAGICIAFSGMFRYTNVPLGLALPLLLLVVAYIKKRELVRGAWATLIISYLLLAAMMLFLNESCGTPLKMVPAEKGLFFSNLTYWYPAIIGSFINVRVTPTLLERLTSIGYDQWLMFLSYFNLLLYLIGVFLIVKFIRRSIKTSFDPYSIFIVSGVLLSLLTIAELGYLSLTNAIKHSINGNTWTYIVEGRYYAPVIVFIQLLFFIEYARLNKYQNRIYSGIMHALMAILLVTCLHQVYFSMKVLMKFDTMKENVLREADYKWFNEALKSHGDTSVLVASRDTYYPLLASIRSQKGIIDPEKLNESTPVTSTPAILYFIMHDNEKARFGSFLNKPGVMLVKKIGSTNFYSLSLPAGNY